MGATNAATYQELAKLPMAIVKDSKPNFTIRADFPTSTTEKYPDFLSFTPYDVGYRLYQVCPIVVQQNVLVQGTGSSGKYYAHKATLRSTTVTFGDAVQTNLPAGSVLLVDIYVKNNYQGYLLVSSVEAVVNDSGTLNDITLPTKIDYYTPNGSAQTNYSLTFTYVIRGIVSLGR